MSTPTTHLHTHAADATTGAARTRKGTVAGIGVALACAIACSLPLLAAGGLTASIGAFVAGGPAIALGVLAAAAALAAAVTWMRRRRTVADATEVSTACGCGSC